MKRYMDVPEHNQNSFIYNLSIGLSKIKNPVKMWTHGKLHLQDTCSAKISYGPCDKPELVMSLIYLI